MKSTSLTQDQQRQQVIKSNSSGSSRAVTNQPAKLFQKSKDETQ